MSWEQRERQRITTNRHKAKILKVNRRLAALSELTGIPLHKMHIRREHYGLGLGTNPAYVRNEETSEIIMECRRDDFDWGTECMIKRRLRRASKGCEVVQKILAKYGLKLIYDPRVRDRYVPISLPPNVITFERISEPKQYDHNAA